MNVDKCPNCGAKQLALIDPPEYECDSYWSCRPGRGFIESKQCITNQQDKLIKERDNLITLAKVVIKDYDDSIDNDMASLGVIRLSNYIDDITRKDEESR